MNETVDVWSLPLVEMAHIDIVKPTNQQKLFHLKNEHVHLSLRTNVPLEMPVKLSYDISPPNVNLGIIYAVSILIVLYGLIIFEVTRNTSNK